jgi:predicted ATP-grasp superfamily ATP-dependent carboligase
VTASPLPHVVVLGPGKGGLAAARGLVRAGERVSALALAEDRFVLRSRGVRGRLIPDDEEAWLDALLRVAAGEPTLVLSDSDRVTQFLASRRADIPGHLRTFEADDSAHLTMLDKERANAVAREAGVLVPWSILIDSEARAHDALERAVFPCIVKPVFSHLWRERFGLERVYLVEDARQLKVILQRGLDAAMPVITSQYVAGG